MKNVLIGAHNVATAYKPKYWLMNLFNFTSKCQNLTVDKLLDKNVRFFDIRVKYDNKGNFILSHGLVDYKVTLIDILNEFKKFIHSNPKEVIYYRIFHENTMYLTSLQMEVNNVPFDNFVEDIKDIIDEHLSNYSKNIVLLDIRSKEDFNQCKTTTDYKYSYINTGWIKPTLDNYMTMCYYMGQIDYDTEDVNKTIIVDENYISKGAWWSLFIPIPKVTAKQLRGIVDNRIKNDSFKKLIHIYFIDFC